jgi:hypothetical protein
MITLDTLDRIDTAPWRSESGDRTWFADTRRVSVYVDDDGSLWLSWVSMTPPRDTGVLELEPLVSEEQLVARLTWLRRGWLHRQIERLTCGRL